MCTFSLLDPFHSCLLTQKSLPGALVQRPPFRKQFLLLEYVPVSSRKSSPVTHGYMSPVLPGPTLKLGGSCKASFCPTVWPYGLARVACNPCRQLLECCCFLKAWKHGQLTPWTWTLLLLGPQAHSIDEKLEVLTFPENTLLSWERRQMDSRN